jgi:Flp pilus assembly protein TadB
MELSGAVAMKQEMVSLCWYIVNVSMSDQLPKGSLHVHGSCASFQREQPKAVRPRMIVPRPQSGQTSPSLGLFVAMAGSFFVVAFVSFVFLGTFVPLAAFSFFSGCTSMVMRRGSLSRKTSFTICVI